MRHLCVDARLYDGGGIGTHLKAILPRLENFSLTLLTNKYLDIDFPASQVVIKSPIYSIKEQIELPIKIPPCDLFWSPHYNIPLSPIRAKKRLVTIHDVYHLAHFSSLSLREKIYSRLMVNAALHHSDVIMTDSYFSEAEIRKYCKNFKKKLSVVPSCYLTYPDKQYFDELPQEYILYVGAIRNHKNIARLLQAYELLKNPPTLVFAGKKYNNISLPSYVCDLGYVPDEALPQLYKNAILFVFPSLYEGFGIPPLEAMYYGCPSVVSNAASLPEVCGNAVHYVDPLSIISIKQGIEFLLNNPNKRDELIKIGREHVKFFSPENSAKKFVDTIHSVM